MKIGLRTRLILSFLGVIAATAALVVMLAHRITSERFTYLVSNTGQMHAHSLAPLLAARSVAGRNPDEGRDHSQSQ